MSTDQPLSATSAQATTPDTTTPDTAASATSAAGTPPIGGGPSMDRGAMMRSLALSMFFDVGISIAAFVLAKNAGASDAVAYLISSVGPILGLGVEFMRHRRLDAVGVAVLVIIVSSLAVSLIGSTDERVLLLKDAAITGALGLVILASLTPLFRRPLMFYMGRKFGTDGTDESVAYFESLWQYPGFRHSQRLITGVWGAGFTIEAIAKAGWVMLLPFRTAYVLNQIVPLLLTFALMGWTIAYVKRSAARGQARMAAAQADAAQARD